MAHCDQEHEELDVMDDFLLKAITQEMSILELFRWRGDFASIKRRRTVS